MCKVKPKKYQVSVAQPNDIDDSAYQKEQHIQFQVSYEDNIESSLNDPFGQFIEFDDEPEPSTQIPEEDADVDIVLSSDEQNNNAEYFSDWDQEDVN